MHIRRSSLIRNHYFVCGLLVGLILSSYIPQDIWELVQQEECPQQIVEKNLIEKFGQDFEPHLNLINKPLAAKKPVKNVIRPRYYSSELGIREKMFIGVMTNQDNINTLATAINRTTAHLVNKIKFFINADNVKTNYKLKNIVGFTDTRENLRPFHVIKYIADNYLNDYDYFLLIPDSVYVDARKFKAMLYHMSITFDIYMGSHLESISSIYNEENSKHAADNDNLINDDDLKMHGDRNYCDLNAGILLSSSVVRKMRNNLDWCVRNGITNVHSINIGRCVKYSSNLSGCQQSFQGISQQTFALNAHTKLFTDLNQLTKDERFRNATTVYPIKNADDFYRLHAYYSRNHLKQNTYQNKNLETKSYTIGNGSVGNNILDIRWPLGVPSNSLPETRYDIIPWQLINRTHILQANGDTIIKSMNHLEILDFNKIMNITVEYAAYKYSNLEFYDIHTAYKRFDATRGMDYHLHLNFRNKNYKERIVLKSFEVIKPLGRVEVIPSPYVTESTRITILLPTFEHQIAEAIDYVTQYECVCMKNQDNTFLLIIFLYHENSASKGETDPFRSLKTLALDLSTKYKSDGSRIAWLSIRLPTLLSAIDYKDYIMYSSIYGPHELLSIAIADLALPKIGLESLILITSISITLKPDFLNRVRMNTIQGFQVYSPIGFMMYPCDLVGFCKECETCDVSQSTGYFDKHNFDIISFYSRDYVQARKIIDSQLPIIRNDIDIENLKYATTTTTANTTINNILDIFIASQLRLHILRATEPTLRYGRVLKKYFDTKNEIPKCPAFQMQNNHNDNNNLNNINNNLNDKSNINNLLSRDNESRLTLELQHRRKCVHLASRKQIGDSIVRYEDKSILYK